MPHPLRRVIRPLLALAAAALAAACTTVPAEQRAAACRATDWSGYGYNDGILGVPAQDRAAKFADCAELGHPADIAAYQTARAKGLAEYCTLENGYEVGRAGRRYHGVCPADLAQNFLQGYERGRRERPVELYPSVRFGVGVGYYPYWWGYHHHHGHPRPRRHRDGG